MNKRPKRYWLTYLYTSIWDIPSWLAIVVLWLFWGHRMVWLDGVWFEYKENSWPVRTWYKRWAGTTFGHGGVMAPGRLGDTGIDTKTEFHEHIHVEQYEASMLRSFLIAVGTSILLFRLGHPVVACWTGGIVWFSGALMTWVPNWMQAFLRGEEVYRGSHHEEAARSLAEEYVRKQHGLD